MVKRQCFVVFTVSAITGPQRDAAVGAGLFVLFKFDVNYAGVACGIIFCRRVVCIP